jgi:enoyl-CoA hydratase/carnithine racemase
VIRASLEGPVWMIALDRPEKRNAMTPEMLDRAIQAVQETPSYARAILLAGEGLMLCAGFDLKLCQDRPGTLEALLKGLSTLISMLRSVQDRPVVIAAQGAAIAGGSALLGAGDLVVTDIKAIIGYPVVPLGISPAVSAAFLRLCVGDGRARARLLDPALINGREALRLGLAHECLDEAERVQPRALELAHELASKPPHAMAATRRWLSEIERARTQGQDHSDAAEHSLAASLSIVEGEEQRAGLAKLFATKPTEITKHPD